MKGAVLASIAQHPDDRPTTVEELRLMIFQDEPAPPPEPITTRLPGLTAAGAGLWRELMTHHAGLVVTVLLLTATALVVTLLSPALP